MKILKAEVDWHPDFDNAPTLNIWVDEVPHGQVRYEQRGSCYFGEHDGYVSFFHYSHPDEGYGGREFTLNMVDGTVKVLKGPWSGNETSMAAAGFPISFGVTLLYMGRWNEQMDFQEMRVAGHLNEARFLEAFEFCKHEADLIPVVQPRSYSDQCSAEQNIVIGCVAGSSNPDGIRSYLIARKGMTFDQSQAFKRVKRFTKYYYESDWTPEIFWGAEKDRADKQGHRDKMAAHINGLIDQYDLAGFDVDKITELLPVPEPKARPIPMYSFDPEYDDPGY